MNPSRESTKIDLDTYFEVCFAVCGYLALSREAWMSGLLFAVEMRKEKKTYNQLRGMGVYI